MLGILVRTSSGKMTSTGAIYDADKPFTSKQADAILTATWLTSSRSTILTMREAIG